MKESILELVDASYSYDEEIQALININIEIYQGERIAVLGNNGAGKSTFFLILNGVLPLQHGKMIFHEQELKHNKKDLTTLRKQVGYVFQDPDNQIIAPTVESEISFGLMNLKLPEEETKERINEAVNELNLMQYRKSPPHYLSGGEKKRVSIADILVMKPEVLLFDEPTASLDGKNVAAFEEILEKQSVRGRTTLISTHDIDFAWRWAERIVVFHQGEIVADDIPEKIFRNEELLKRTSLKKPVIYKMTEILCKIVKIKMPVPMPRNEVMFENFLKSMEGKITYGESGDFSSKFWDKL